MKTYWDHTEQERSQLTDDEVRAMLDVELMTKGVRKPVPPTLKEVPKSPLGERKRVFSVEAKSKYGSNEATGIVFERIEQAQAFIELNPMKRDYDYEIGNDFRYCMSLTEPHIITEEVYSLDQINQFRNSLKERKAIADDNQRQQAEYNKASAAAERITDGVWADWHTQVAKAAALREIGSTFADYMKLTNGDAAMAFTFLSKVHNAEEIATAREWFPDLLPVAQAADSAS